MIKISILIPVFNEILFIEDCLKEIKKYQSKDFEYEIIISDNNSTDGTKFFLESIVDEGIKILYQKTNHGKGSNLINCLKHVSGDIVIIQDADLEYSPENYKDLILPILNNKANVVFGNRFAKSKPFHVYSFIHLIANKAITLFANVLFNRSFSDILTGYKVFKHDLIKDYNFTSKNFDIDTEMTAFFCKNKKAKIYEVPISIYSRSYSEGKKINILHFFLLIFSLIKNRFI